MKSLLLGGVAAFAVSSFAWADAPPTVKMPVKMTDQQLDQVVAGWNRCLYHNVCGNNGWGNGYDGTNPGSGHGATSPSKLANGNAGPGINTNPTNSNGR
jgi:hypothetical protein